MNKPLVTIALPVFNGRDFLNQAIRSILKQDYANFELIILDNCSTDNTEQLCLSYCQLDKRIKYVRHPTNLGALENFNRAIDYANGDYFMYAAHDDLWEPNYVSELLKLLIVNDTVGLAFSQLDFIDENGKIIEVIKRPSPVLRNTYSGFHNFLNYLLKYYHDYIVYGLFSTSFIKKALPFEPVRGKPYHATALFLLRFLTMAKASCTTKVLFHYRMKTREDPLGEHNRLRQIKNYATIRLYLLSRINTIVHGSSFSSIQKFFLYVISTVVISNNIARYSVRSLLPISVAIKAKLNKAIHRTKS